jgi:hypothetical protein
VHIILLPEHPINGHKGEGTFCLYDGDADHVLCAGTAGISLFIHEITDNPINVYETAVTFYKNKFFARFASLRLMFMY